MVGGVSFPQVEIQILLTRSVRKIQLDELHRSHNSTATLYSVVSRSDMERADGPAISVR